MKTVALEPPPWRQRIAGRRFPSVSCVGRDDGPFTGVMEREIVGVPWPERGSPRSWCFVGAAISVMDIVIFYEVQTEALAKMRSE